MKVKIEEAITEITNEDHIVILFENGYEEGSETEEEMESWYGYGLHNNEKYVEKLISGRAESDIFLKNDQFEFDHAVTLIRAGDWTSIILKDRKNPDGGLFILENIENPVEDE